MGEALSPVGVTEARSGGLSMKGSVGSIKSAIASCASCTGPGRLSGIAVGRAGECETVFSPSELEGHLFQDDRVADCAVLGVEDPQDGSELPWAFVVAAPGLNGEPGDRKDLEKQILESVNSQVNASYKKLRGITWIEKLPKSDAGKILKKDLRAKANVA